MNYQQQEEGEIIAALLRDEKLPPFEPSTEYSTITGVNGEPTKDFHAEINLDRLTGLVADQWRRFGNAFDLSYTEPWRVIGG